MRSFTCFLRFLVLGHSVKQVAIVLMKVVSAFSTAKSDAVAGASLHDDLFFFGVRQTIVLQLSGPLLVLHHHTSFLVFSRGWRRW